MANRFGNTSGNQANEESQPDYEKMKAEIREQVIIERAAETAKVYTKGLLMMPDDVRREHIARLKETLHPAEMIEIKNILEDDNQETS